MKKTLTILMTAFLVIPVVALGVGNTNATTGSSTTITTVQNQVQTQTQTKNQGEETQIQIQTQTQLEQDIEDTKQQYQAKNEKAESRSSEVAKAVQSMLEVANRMNNPEIGEQIRAIAKEQNQAEDKANQAMDKIQDRNGFTKFFIGANYGQIKEVKQLMEQNQERIRELQQIMTQLSNEADQTEIQNQINILELQNLSLANQLQEEGAGFTLFGWFVRWFYGV